jgi:predicted transcriptional regulator
MLYGFIRGNPGAHLKQLSEEFAMKTSSILWHIRKLESAELVKSERVGGYRVFYAVDGGIEIKRVSRAITSLQNDNARRIFARIQSKPGVTTRQLSDALGIHGGTVRWHLRKLRDAGLLDELVQEAGSKFFNTPLGDRAMETMEGAPTTPAPRSVSRPVPE